jgi:hypothetical protein
MCKKKTWFLYVQCITGVSEHKIKWSLPESAGVHWSPLESAGVCWSPLESAGVHWSLPESTGVCWSLLESSGLHQSYWTPADSIRVTGLRQTPADSSRWHSCDKLESAGVRRSPFAVNGVQRTPPEYVGECKVLSLGIQHLEYVDIREEMKTPVKPL